MLAEKRAAVSKHHRNAGRHLREYWRGEREQESTPAYAIEERGASWFVVVAGEDVAGPLATNSAAWRWIDRHSVARRTIAIASGHWRCSQSLCEYIRISEYTPRCCRTCSEQTRLSFWVCVACHSLKVPYDRTFVLPHAAC